MATIRATVFSSWRTLPGHSAARYAGMPTRFAYPAALGDFVTALLAVLAIPAVAKQARGASALVWLFNVVGAVDLAAAITLANIHRAAPFMGPAYWIPAFWVPALLVTHYVVFAVLWRARRRLASCPSRSKWPSRANRTRSCWTTSAAIQRCDRGIPAR
jgi:hypothetical protein